MIFLGIDSGTQSTKTIACDPATGEILASAQSPYGLIPGLPPGHLEQHPDTWTAAAAETIASVLAQLGHRKDEIRGIGVSGQQHGFVPLDAADRPIRPAKLWCDTSTIPQCEQFSQAFGGPSGLITLAGNPILPGYTAPKILWLKQNEPHNFALLRTVLLPHDYLNLWLTGEKTMEYGDASGTGLLDIRTRQWNREIVNFIDPELHACLPRPQSSAQPAGLLRPALAAQWGLPPGIIVSAGGGDNMMGAIGTGNTSPGAVTVSLGTSGTLYAHSAAPIIDPDGEVAAFCDSSDAWMPLVCTMNVTVATEQVRHLLRWTHADMEQNIAATPAGADGLLFLPYLNGERTPNLPAATGVLHGLTTANYHPAHLARATLEGATLGLAYGLRRFTTLGLHPTEIRLTGGGSKSPIWRQIAADIFGVPTVTLRTSEGAALGAALQAAWTARFQPTLTETIAASVLTDESTRALPNPAAHALYTTLLDQQTTLARALHATGHL